MIDFACKEFNLRDIIKCSQGLTRAEYGIFEYLLRHHSQHTTEDLAKAMGLDLSTVQRTMKHLHEKQLVKRLQRNLDGGGYVFEYQIADRKAIRRIVMATVHTWAGRVEQELEQW